MFEHILLPLDLQPVDEAVVTVVGELTSGHRARVTILHVIEEIEDVDDAEIRSFYERLERRARQRLQPTVAILEDRGLEIALEIRLGRRAEEIVRFAAEHGVDLVAMRSRHLGEAAGQSWPTLSMQIAMVSPVPVLLLR